MNSIFRKKKIYTRDLESNSKSNSEKLNFRTVTHANGIPRARRYSLSCKLYFTKYSGSTIQELIETNFDYFTWLPRNIENFIYDEHVIEYAETCLKLLEKIETYPAGLIQTELGKAINQVDAMIEYEHSLDFENDEDLLLAYKAEINVKYYKTIINTPNERLIRQAREIEGNSPGYRRRYFEEIKTNKK